MLPNVTKEQARGQTPERKEQAAAQPADILWHRSGRMWGYEGLSFQSQAKYLLITLKNNLEEWINRLPNPSLIQKAPKVQGYNNP